MVVKQRSLTLLFYFSFLFSNTAYSQFENRHHLEVKTAPIRYTYGPNIEGELRFDNYALIGGYQVYHRDFYLETGGFYEVYFNYISINNNIIGRKRFYESY